MPISVKPGTRLFSRVGDAELIVVKALAGEVELTLGGHAPATTADERGAPIASTAEHGGSVQIGKRYVNEAGTIELLCTKPGEGVPALAGVLLGLKEAKPLPASD